MTRAWPAIVLMLMLAPGHLACGSSTDGTPTSPSAPASPPPALSGLALSQLPSQIVVGARVQLQATARFSDGSVQTVTPLWAVTPQAEITPVGMLLAKSVGSATVSATYQGVSANSSVFIVPDYSGTWRGGWRRLECFGPRCSEGDRANAMVELLIAQHTGLSASLSAVMSFGPWDETRYVLTGRGNVGIAPTTALFLFWLERGASGERLRENQIELTSVAVDAAQTLSARGSMLLREGAETTRLEFTLDRLGLVSRTVSAATHLTGPPGRTWGGDPGLPPTRERSGRRTRG